MSVQPDPISGLSGCLQFLPALSILFVISFHICVRIPVSCWPALRIVRSKYMCTWTLTCNATLPSTKVVLNYSATCILRACSFSYPGKNKRRLPIFVNGILLEHSQVHLFTCCLGCFQTAELSRCNREYVPSDPRQIYLLSGILQKKFSLIHNSQDMEAMEVSTDRQLDKETAVCPVTCNLLI